jgi:hypothetical protein
LPSELVEFLELLARELRACDEQSYANAVEAAITGTADERTAFLESNALWGGAGSIADQAGIRGNRGDGRRHIERALLELGHEQIRVGIVNSRTSMWVEAFDQWAAQGI